MTDIIKKDENTPADSGSMSRMFALSRFDDFFKEIHDHFWSRFDKMFEDWDLNMQTFENLQPKGSFPKVNVVDNPENYEVEIAVAGFSKDDVSLEFKDNALFIKAECCNENEDKPAKSYLRREIAHRSFRRVINFPAEVNSDAIEANYNDGIIKVSVAKVVEEKPESIKIEVK